MKKKCVFAELLFLITKSLGGFLKKFCYERLSTHKNNVCLTDFNCINICHSTTHAHVNWSKFEDEREKALK